MKQICTKQFNSNDVMSLHRDMTAVKTPNETSGFSERGGGGGVRVYLEGGDSGLSGGRGIREHPKEGSSVTARYI